MMKFNTLLFIPLLMIVTECTSEKSEKDSVIEKKVQTPALSTDDVDTTHIISPVQIGNDKGQVEITGIKTFTSDTLKNGEFTIRLKDIKCCPIERPVNRLILIDSNSTVLFKDTISRDYTSEAVLSSVTFDFVRGSTLYFNAELQNEKEEKVIYGRFNLFYSSERKGEVYGWITDSLTTIK